MSQPVSQRFLNAQFASANYVTSKVQLVLGNYFSADAYGTTIASNGDDSSGDYPAIGAIDGDRTEINIGAPASADDNIGLSSWRSAAPPSGGSPSILTFTLAQATDINRIKLYHLSTDALTSYDLQYYNGTSWVIFAATSDRATGSQVSIVTTGKLDIINFPDITATQWRLSVYGSTSGAANVVEIEAYRLIDITSRVKAIKPSRQRDYKLVNPMAAALQIDCINTDRYFSVSHIPTAAEAAMGFVNQELAPGIGIIVQMGFNYYASVPEMVTVFTGEVDAITINPASRDATIQHRDVLKKVINHAVDSSKLKTNIDISDAIRYILNRTNISNYEMALDQTGINLPYFFTDQQAALDTIRDLAQAGGDTAFYIDELGFPTFKDYSSNIPNQQILEGETYFESGTLANISTKGFAAGDLAVPPQFLPLATDGALTGSLQVSGSNLTFPSSATFAGASFDLGGGSFTTVGTTERWVAQPYNIPIAGTITSLTVGGWNLGTIPLGQGTHIEVWKSIGGNPDNLSILYSSALLPNEASPVTVSPSLHISTPGLYFVVVHLLSSVNTLKLNTAPTSGSTRAFSSSSPSGGGGGWGIVAFGMVSGFNFTHDALSGTWTTSWYDSGSIAVNLMPTITDLASYPSGTSGTIFLDGGDDGSTAVVSYSTGNLNGTWIPTIVQHRYWRLRISASMTGNSLPSIGAPNLLFAPSGTWISPIVDTGSETKAYGSITSDNVPNGGTIAFSTQSSPDGVTWSGYIATSISGQIMSPVQRYLQVMVVIILGPGGITPLILDITVGWSGGTGSIKYPLFSSFTFSFDSLMFDVQQVLADNLGGDSSILNDILVQAEPLVLTGGTPDDLPGLTNVIWNGTIGIPPVNISPTTPLTVTTGQILTFTPYISGGMDITYMSGANPQAAVVTFAGGAAGSWAFTNIHPTLPVLQITITNSGQISGLTINGLTFSNASYLQTQEVFDSVSIARYGDRQLSIANTWITSVAAAQFIAGINLANYKQPIAYIASCKVGLSPSIQLGDRVTVDDINLDLTADYIVVGAAHTIDLKSKDKASIETDLTLIAIPAGF